MSRIAAFVSAGVAIAWVALMWSVDPGDDPNGVVVYIDFTVYAIAALSVIWLVVLAVWLTRRIRSCRYFAKPS